jgi:hypothetical protein
MNSTQILGIVIAVFAFLILVYVCAKYFSKRSEKQQVLSVYVNSSPPPETPNSAVIETRASLDGTLIPPPAAIETSSLPMMNDVWQVSPPVSPPPTSTAPALSVTATPPNLLPQTQTTPTTVLSSSEEDEDNNIPIAPPLVAGGKPWFANNWNPPPHHLNPQKQQRHVSFNPQVLLYQHFPQYV